MRFLPIFMDTKSRKIVVFGGNDAAEAKLRTLIKTEAEIIIVSSVVSNEINNWVEAHSNIAWLNREYNPDQLSGAILAYAATENPDLNARIAQDASAIGIPVNAADQKEDCSFYSPAIVDRSPVVVAIGSEGTSPGLSRALKADIEMQLPHSVGALANTIARLRAKLARKMPDFSDRQRLWAKVFASGKTLEDRLKYSPKDIEDAFDTAFNNVPANKSGKVSLVGAGPGSLDLLTIGAQRRLHSADVIVYDRLVSQEVLDMGRREAKYIYVGKKPGVHTTRQEEINRIIVEEASKGNDVVRLKGGDPLIFGRADEEIEALETAGVNFEIVPGITSAAAAAASIGASLTSRGRNKSVALITGHDAKGFAEQDWASLAQDGSRAAIYMGLGASRFIQGRLLLHGAKSDYPVAIVENASRNDQKIVRTTLGQLAQAIESNEIIGPAILLLGYEAMRVSNQVISELRAGL